MTMLQQLDWYIEARRRLREDRLTPKEQNALLCGIDGFIRNYRGCQPLALAALDRKRQLGIN